MIAPVPVVKNVHVRVCIYTCICTYVPSVLVEVSVQPCCLAKESLATSTDTWVKQWHQHFGFLGGPSKDA